MAQGRKTGGRAKGTPNKATLEREEEAARALDRSRATGRPLAKDRLDELLDVALGAMQRHQPVTRDMVQRARAAGNTAVKESKGDWGGFGDWWDRAAFAAKALAPYQSPQLKAIAMQMAPPPEPTKVPEPANVHQIDDANAASRVYLRTVKGAMAA
jgi:hypothetical protein